MSISRLERQKLRLKQLKEALKNLEIEDFGVCIDCGEDIEFKLLQLNLTVKNALTA